MSASTCHQCGQPLTGDNPCTACMWQLVQSPDESPTVHMPDNGLPVVTGHEILEELARGGMGIVFRALQKEPHREVALKMLLPFDHGRHDVRERFHVEITALADLDHPGILPLYQVGETSGRPWFTMKLAAGGSLASRLKRKRKPSDPESAAKLIADMADAVQHAHAHGVLHRDIKPGNILFDERGGAYLADFGLAKLLDSTTDMTVTAAVLGTPCYMAPEVAEKGARAATTASDIYGLGAVLYELLSGRPPFMVEGLAALVKKIIEDEPERPSTIVHGVPRDLELVCLTCLAKDPRQRYASAADVAADLRRWMNGEPVAARRASSAVRLWAWARRRPALAAVSAALILTILTAGTWLAINSYELRRALAAEREARERADEQSKFLIGEFADELQKIGRLQLILDACEKASQYDDPADDAGYIRRARLLKRWASALLAKGDTATAVPKLREAMESMDALVSREPTNKDAFSLALETRCRLAEALADSTSFSGAMAQLEQADRAVASPGVLALDETLRLQAEVDRTRAMILNRHTREDAEATFAAANRAVAAFSNWQAREPGDRERTLALAQALREAGRTWYNSSGEHPDPPNLAEALPLFAKGAELMRAIPDRSRAEDFELAFATGWMGDCLLRMEGKGPAAAAPLHKEEFDIVSELVARDPLNGEWQHKLANSHISLAEQNHEASKNEAAAGNQAVAKVREEAALGHWIKCLRILKQLHEEAPDVRNWTLNYLRTLRREGFRALKNGDAASAAPLLDDCTKIAAERVTAMPDSIIEREGWRDVTDEIGGALKRIADLPGADKVFRYAVAIAEKYAARAGPGQPWWEATLLHFKDELASVSQDAAAHDQWLTQNLPAFEQRAAAAGQRAATIPDSIPECQVWKELTDTVGKLHEDRKDWPRALSVFGSARDLAVKTAPLAGKGRLWWEWTLAHYHRRVAAVSKETGATVERQAENLRALEIRVRHLETGSPYAIKDPAGVANAFQSTISALLSNQQPDLARDYANRCLKLYLDHRDTAGPAYEWAKVIIAACEAFKKGETLAPAALTLAAEAAAKLYPAESRAGLGEKDGAAAEKLERLAAPL